MVEGPEMLLAFEIIKQIKELNYFSGMGKHVMSFIGDKEDGILVDKSLNCIITRLVNASQNVAKALVDLIKDRELKGLVGFSLSAKGIFSLDFDNHLVLIPFAVHSDTNS